MFGQMFGANKTLVALWVYFQCIRESMTLTRYRESPKGRAELERMYWEGRLVYPPHLLGK